MKYKHVKQCKSAKVKTRDFLKTKTDGYYLGKLYRPTKLYFFNYEII